MEECNHTDHSHDSLIPCREVARRVYAFIDGELDVRELEEFEAHIKLCLPCKDLVKFEEKLVQTIREKLNGQTSKVPVPATLHEKIKKAIDLSRNP
jgi:anti-sigma factor (TIGR02949 family)